MSGIADHGDSSTPNVGVACGRCGSEAVAMLTCNSFHETGHPWVLATVCDGCQKVWWTESRCLDCDGVTTENGDVK